MKIPYWLRNLDKVRAEFQSVRWPKSAEEGMRQVLALSEQGWTQLLAGLRAENPGASARKIEASAHRYLQRWESSKRELLFVRKR
jgi:hypothetical protein